MSDMTGRVCPKCFSDKADSMKQCRECGYTGDSVNISDTDAEYESIMSSIPGSC